jgi:hypothetical protein
MATITADKTIREGGVKKVIWETMGNDDTGTSISLADHPDKTVDFIGTFGGATVILQGSQDDATWSTMVDSGGTALSFTAASTLKLIRDNPFFIRAKTSGGSGTDIDVIISAVR